MFDGARCSSYFFHLLLILQAHSVEFTRAEDTIKWNVTFDNIVNNTFAISLGLFGDINLSIVNLDESRLRESNATIRVVSHNRRVVEIDKIISLDEIQDGAWNGSFTVVPVTLGITNASVEIVFPNSNPSVTEVSSESMQITVMRNHYLIDLNQWLPAEFWFYLMHLFYVLINVAVGASLKLNELKAIARYPVGPFLCFLVHLILFPFTSCMIGLALFPNNLRNRLSLIGISITIMGIGTEKDNWTILFGGNITMVQANGISIKILACGIGFIYRLMVQSIHSLDILDPYHLFVWDTYFFGLSMAAGVLIQNIFPQPTKYLVKYAWILSLMMIASSTFVLMNHYLDLYVFGLFTWQTILAGFASSIFIYSLGWGVTLALKMKYEDCVAIVVDITTKYMYFAMHILVLISQQPGDFVEIYSGAVMLTTTLVLVTHLGWIVFKRKPPQTESTDKLKPPKHTKPKKDLAI